MIANSYLERRYTKREPPHHTCSQDYKLFRKLNFFNFNPFLFNDGSTGKETGGIIKIYGDCFGNIQLCAINLYILSWCCFLSVASSWCCDFIYYVTRILLSVFPSEDYLFVTYCFDSLADSLVNSFWIWTFGRFFGVWV